MGIISGLLGKRIGSRPGQIASELSPILASTESVQFAYKVIRDMFVFTDKRLILIDKQGVTGKKVNYHSIPYRSISHFAVETTGHFDLDAELKIWISSNPEPITKQLKKGTNIVDVQRTIATFMFV